MKKIMNIFVLVAAAAMALVSCQRQEIPETETNTSKSQEYLYRFDISANAKSAIGDNCVVWEEDDKIGVYASTSVNQSGNVTVDPSVSFTVKSTVALTAGDKVYCYYPYASHTDDATAVSMTIPTEQTEKDQMPMVSLPFAIPANIEVDTEKSVGEISFANLGSIIEFYVYSTTPEYQTEKIQSVTFNAVNAIAGDFAFDITSVDYSKKETLKISGYAAKSVVSTLATPVVVPSEVDAAKVVKMVVAPCENNGKVVVTTDKAKYTYTLPTYEFVRSGVKTYSLNLREDVREAIVASTATLSSEEIKTTIAASKCAYGTEVVYDDAADGVVWKSTCYTDAADRPWLQMKKDDSVYIAIESDGNIEEVVVTVTGASNSSGGVLDISAHTAFAGTLSLNTANGTKVASGTATDNIVTLVPNSANKTLYLKTSSGARVWNIEVKKSGVVNTEPSIGASDVAGISARGVENEELTYVIANPNGSQLSLECDGTVVTAVENIDDTIKYTVSANMTGEIRQGNITIKYGAEQKVVKISQNAPVFTVSRPEVELDADADASTQVTITNDFDWTSELSSDKFTISPAVYEWSDGGKQIVVIKTKSANESSEGTLTLGTVTFTSATGQELVVTVKQKSSYVDNSVTTATLTFDDTAKRTSYSATQQVWEENGITFINLKNNSQNDIVENYNPVRIYAGSSVSISMQGGLMSKIEFVCGNSSYATALKNSIGSEATASNTVVTLVLTTPAATYDISKMTAQARLNSLTVTYAASGEGGGTPEQPTLSPRNLEFSAATATATMGQAFTEPTLSGETAGVTYSSSNTAVATVDASTGDVTLVSAGTTTITASAPATTQYEAGDATYTLTVNPAQGVQQTTTTYTFNSKSWGDSTQSWTSGKDGAQYTSGQGVQVTSTYTGANATCKTTLSNVSSVEVSYCTNKSSGNGSITIAIGSVTKTVDVAKSGSDGRTLKTLTLDFSSELPSGTPKITVACSANSVYINALTFTHTN